jgi:hypothetical protein
VGANEQVNDATLDLFVGFVPNEKGCGKVKVIQVQNREMLIRLLLSPDIFHTFGLRQELHGGSLAEGSPSIYLFIHTRLQFQFCVIG